MPLTISHPAAAIPFRKLGFPLSALVIGSMTPDAAKIVTLHPSASLGHSLDGIFWFCIPAGLIALALFHFLFKRPCVALLPDKQAMKFASLLSPISFWPLRNFLLISSALALGAFTHLAWDSFTHEYGWAAHHIPLLQQTVFETSGREIKGYKVAQHGSTVFGAALLCFWSWNWFKNAPGSSEQKPAWPFQSSKTSVRIFLLLSIALPAIAFGLWKLQSHSGLRMLQIFAGRTAVAGMAISVMAMFIYGLIYLLKCRQPNRAN